MDKNTNLPPNNVSKSFRAFFAINISNKLQQDIAQLIESLRATHKCPKVRWVKPENLHITLRFLGNITDDQYNRIVAVIGDTIAANNSFAVSLTELMLFPSPYSPHAIVLQPKTMEQLIGLGMKIEDEVIRCGFTAERRPFVPHLTIGRLSGKVKVTDEFLADFAKCKSDLHLSGLNFPVNEVILFKSTPTPQGSLYTPLICFPLA